MSIMSRDIAAGIVTMTLCLLIQVSPAYAGNDSLLVLFWNLENFFDWRDSGLRAGFTQSAMQWPRRCYGQEADTGECLMSPDLPKWKTDLC